MNSRQRKIVLVFVDLLAINAAWTVYFLFRVRSGLIGVAVEPDFWQPMVFVYLFWLLLFWIVGLYRPWYAASRFDELMLVFKTTVFGCLFLFFAIFVDDAGQSAGVSSRVLIALYLGVLMAFVGMGRLVLRSVQRRMLISGIGTHNTIIVGSSARSRELFDDVVKFPALGYKIVGFVRLDRRKYTAEEKGPRFSDPWTASRTLSRRWKSRKCLLRWTPMTMTASLESLRNAAGSTLD